ncbi:hypothetical protein AU191_06645 [Mycolicibacterium acapulense]|nr:hypothetical protein AU191_06645 [Mycolicibacterium acapulense]
MYGIVQALLVTKHLLFVGYSLTDEDFHELVDEIRTALGPIAGSQRQLGTVLTISYSPLADLWKDLLRVEQLGTRGEPPGRRLQMLLDRVAHLATPRHTYLLDKEFDGLLTDDERVLKGRLKEVERVVADSDSHAASTVRQILETLGAPHRGGQ